MNLSVLILSGHSESLEIVRICSHDFEEYVKNNIIFLPATNHKYM